MAEVVRHGQAFVAPAGGQAVAHEVHAPQLVDVLGKLQRHALRCRPPDLLAPAHGQVRLEDRDAGERRQQQHGQERLADDAVLVADEHPHHADEGGRDECPDRDPDRRAQDLGGLG